VSTLEDIENAIARLPREDFARLDHWYTGYRLGQQPSDDLVALRDALEQQPESTWRGAEDYALGAALAGISQPIS